MFENPVLLIVVIAVFIAAVWLSDQPLGARFKNSGRSKKHLDARWNDAYAPSHGEAARMYSGYAQPGQDAIRRLHQESGSY